MFSLTTICFLLSVSSAFALELSVADEEEVRGPEQMPYEWFGNYGSHRESLAFERQISSKHEQFSWRDCGGSGSQVHLKFFSISPLPLRLPGKITVAFKLTIDADIEGPISVAMVVKKKFGAIWVDVCKHIPGGCNREDICKLLSTATQAEGFEDVLQQSFCPLKKGDFNIPPTPFSLTTKAPSGWYEITASFLKEKKRIACMYVKLNIK